MKRLALAAAAVVFPLLASGCAGDDALPKDGTMEACIEALGGREALEELRVIHTVDSLSLAGMSGTTESWWVREPFMGYSVTGIGPVVQQVLIIGDSVWTVDRNGHLSPGGVEQRDQMELSRATIFYDHLLVPSGVSIGPDTMIDGVAAFPLRLEDQPNVVFYHSRETMLPVLMTASTMGIAVENRPGGYRTVDGIVTSTRSTSSIPALGQEMVTWNVLTEYNAAVPESVFVLASAGADWELEDPGTPRPVHLRGEHLYLDGTVEGRPVNILLDSGAGATVIDSSLAAELGLTGTGQLTARGIGGTRDFSLAEVASYSAAGAHVSNQTLPVMPMADEFHSFTGERIDLIIGYDFLSRFVTRIDYGSRTITLFDPDGFQPDLQGATVLPAQRSMGLLSVEAVLEDSIPVRLLLDTGAGGNVHLTPAFFRRHPEFLSKRPVFETEMQGVGGPDTITGFRVSTVTLGDHRVPGGLCSSFSGGDMLDVFDGILGNGVLSRFVVHLDYGSTRVILEPSSIFLEGLPEGLTGMGLETLGGRMLIGNVIAGSAADEAGVRRGDVLLEVDGVPVPDAPPWAVSDMFPESEGVSVRLSLLRDGTDIETVMVTRRLVP